MCEPATPAYQVDSSLVDSAIDEVVGAMSQSTKDHLLRHIIADAIDNGGDVSDEASVKHGVGVVFENLVDNRQYITVDTEAVHHVAVVATAACNLTMGAGGDPAAINDLIEATLCSTKYHGRID